MKTFLSSYLRLATKITIKLIVKYSFVSDFWRFWLKTDIIWASINSLCEYIYLMAPFELIVAVSYLASYSSTLCQNAGENQKIEIVFVCTVLLRREKRGRGFRGNEMDFDKNKQTWGQSLLIIRHPYFTSIQYNLLALNKSNRRRNHF